MSTVYLVHYVQKNVRGEALGYGIIGVSPSHEEAVEMIKSTRAWEHEQGFDDMADPIKIRPIDLSKNYAIDDSLDGPITLS